MTTVINIYEVSCHIMTASCHLCVTKMLTLHDKTTLPTFVSFVHRQFKIHSLKEKVRSRSIHIPVVRGCRVLTICARTTELGKTWKLEQEKETETRFSCRKSVCVGRRFAFQVTLYKLSCSYSYWQQSVTSKNRDMGWLIPDLPLRSFSTTLTR